MIIGGMFFSGYASLLCTGVTLGSISPKFGSKVDYWLSVSPILGTIITLVRLKKRGYESILDIYKQITPVRRDSLFSINLIPNLQKRIRERYAGVRGTVAVNRPSFVY